MRAAALLLVLLLCAAPVRAREGELPGEAGYQRSKLTYLIPVAFVVSFVLIGAVLLTAALTRRDDTARLRAATAKVDRALGLLGGPSTGTGTYHTRIATDLPGSVLGLGPLPTTTR